MSRTFYLLGRGDRRVLNAYSDANRLWKEILFDRDNQFSSLSLAQNLGANQLHFERLLRKHDFDRWEAQEVMVFSGLSFYLSDETAEGRYKANLISEAFEMSYCSIEVKSLAKKVSALFYLGRGKGYYYE